MFDKNGKLLRKQSVYYFDKRQFLVSALINTTSQTPMEEFQRESVAL